MIYSLVESARLNGLDPAAYLLEAANGGTVFLDEVGELPIATQARLLRVLESKEFIREHDLSSTSTVAQSFRALKEKELIHEEGDGFVVTDVFFSLWLARDI